MRYKWKFRKREIEKTIQLLFVMNIYKGSESITGDQSRLHTINWQNLDTRPLLLAIRTASQIKLSGLSAQTLVEHLQTMTLESRFNVVAKQRQCTRSLNKYHRDCHSTKTCYKCGRNHNALLHNSRNNFGRFS